MTPTTTRALRAAFVTTIKGLIPSEEAHRDRRWSEVMSRDKVPSAALRRFFVSIRDAAAATDGVYSPSSHERRATVLVYASYGALQETEIEDLVSADGNQIFIALAIQPDPIIPGLVSVEDGGWADEDEENGQRWGTHRYEIRYLAHGIPGAT
jgi:hypothetical protein